MLTTDGARETEMNITASVVLRAVEQLPEAQRETVLLVYGEGTLTLKRRRFSPSRSGRL